MLRSLMTAVTGVRAHQVMLDVTGNNIANVNTTGFKRDTTVFQDLLYQTSQGATGPGNGRGGVNPSQVGLGVRVAAIETIHSQGFAQFTGNRTDMMIDGAGYFILRDGGSRIFTRAGNFTMDAANSLVHSGTGFNVQGFRMIRDPNNPMEFIRAGDVSDIRIPMGDKMEARATSIVGFSSNLDSRSGPFLPIGFADLPSVDGSREVRVMIQGVPYNMTFVTNLGSSTDGLDYFSITIGQGGIDQVINFHMVGITDDGFPLLEPDLTGSPFTLPGSTTDFEVIFNDQTGAVQFREVGTGATLWRTNLFENMSYNTFTMGSGVDAVRFIAEFDESTMGGDTPMRLTLWWQDPTAGPLPPGVMVRADFDVFVNQDGTFDSITPVGGFGALPALPGTWTWRDEDALPTPVGDLGLVISRNGRGIEFMAPNVPDGANRASIGAINQGGFHATKVTIFDCQGTPYTLEVVFKKITGNRWRWEAFIPGDNVLHVNPSSGEILFGDCGQILSGADAEITINFGMNATSFQTIRLDFTGESFGRDPMQGVTQFAGESTTRGFFQDGFPMGVLFDFSVGQDGTIRGMYTNGQNIPLYRIALAQFANPGGLEKIGDTMFRESANSGMASINPAQTGGVGSIIGSTLEMSNVDLTEEFTRLIIAQRGFQANTRIVSVSDSILEEVVNMKR